ncbi:urea ABC transporter permease subunit UrtB [Prosthecomicrobium pneumaticum]|uniref:Urea transport system permease protein n=1 Tax=Prosthecomicrobium pneumaticum TaxID=81895 RepID=A0A7W9FM39_9HYPH|nr:urea ABC transporter permease subunit UrtB [Prosthecomicrobium pneumaticum]MBB5753195.1 urea transport system permease protein [Prosthecomicrobium pneumaticum]
MTRFGAFLTVLLAALVLLAAVPRSEAAEIRPLVDALGKGGYSELDAAIGALAATGDPAAANVLQALGDGTLQVRKSDGAVFIVRETGGSFTLVDPVTGAEAGTESRGGLERIRVNNRVRRTIAAAMGSLTLMSPEISQRRAAVETIFRSGDPTQLPLLDEAIARESDPAVKQAMVEARASAVLKSDRPEADKIAAVDTLRTRGGQDALALLTAASGTATGALKAAIDEAIGTIEGTLRLWQGAQNIWYGLSLGSVLLLAAIGLAITFGVMGVINMAHGEMVMIGAYTTFVVQEFIRTSAPWLFDWSLAIALPLAFLVAGAVGVAIERGVIRFLYGRPLETLLATWGLSLILQQGVRTIFGPTNRQVGNPSWMSGSFQIGELAITYNRMWIIVFALAVFAILILVLRYTPFGLQMRAVTQNRPMASSMGIRTPWVDAFTFGLGSGIAGIAGVALSQVDNVSPDLGQSYIIDSFMVVVFGGVGNLWGTLVGALTLGVANKFIEPFAGAVLGKILVLVFIILFIQKRPRGLFALKGRAVEA